MLELKDCASTGPPLASSDLAIHIFFYNISCRNCFIVLSTNHFVSLVNRVPYFLCAKTLEFLELMENENIFKSMLSSFTFTV